MFAEERIASRYVIIAHPKVSKISDIAFTLEVLNGQIFVVALLGLL